MKDEKREEKNRGEKYLMRKIDIMGEREIERERERERER